MTLIAVSIALHDISEVSLALERATQAIQAGARLIEWRVDGLLDAASRDEEYMDTTLRQVQLLVHDSPAPCIVTCRPAWEGGEYLGSDEDRATLLRRLIETQPPRYIDVELDTFRRNPGVFQPLREALQRQSTHDLSTSLIVSTHDFHGRPADLLQRIEQMTNDPLCSVIKVAWQARSLRDNLEAFDLLQQRRKPTIAICMGPFGLLSRVLAPKFGGLLTFATDHHAEVTGPGQPTIEELLRLYRMTDINASTRVFGVIGWPVSHSRSPAIHNAGFHAIGFDGVYLPLPIPTEYEHFKATVGALIDHAGLNFRGASVTIPHKQHLLRFVQERGGRSDDLTQLIGAANTLTVGSAGGLECTNTDCPAAVEALCEGMNINTTELRGRRIAVLGAGGVARAVVAGLRQHHADIVIFNRTAERAARLIEHLRAGERPATNQSRSDAILEAGTFDQLERERFDVYINCTPVGMEGGADGGESPLPPGVKLDESVTVFDTVYAPPRTPLIAEAESRGARVVLGLDLFVRQAALQFEHWTGVPAPLETFKSVLSD